MTRTAGARPAWAAAVLLLLPALVAASEPAPTPRTPAKGPAKDGGPDLFGGFSYLHSGEANLKGWNLAGSFRLRRSLRLVADLGGHYGSFAGADLSQLTFLGGVRQVWHEGQRLRPFGEVLAGGSRSKSTFADLSASETAWGGALGVGTDYGLKRKGRWALRGQAHLLLLHTGGGWDVDPRLSAGVAYRFGR